MRVAIYTAFIALAASLTSATAVSTGAIELTADQIIEITGTSQKPPFKNPDPSNPNNNGWKFPSTSKLQLAKNVGGNCNFTVIMDVVSKTYFTSMWYAILIINLSLSSLVAQDSSLARRQLLSLTTRTA